MCEWSCDSINCATITMIFMWIYSTSVIYLCESNGEDSMRTTTGIIHLSGCCHSVENNII